MMGLSAAQYVDRMLATQSEAERVVESHRIVDVNRKRMLASSRKHSTRPPHEHS